MPRFQYRLLEPMRAWRPDERPRREVLVSMNADYLDQTSPHCVEGDPELVTEITEAIRYAGGYRGESIEGGITTPQDLDTMRARVEALGLPPAR